MLIWAKPIREYAYGLVKEGKDKEEKVRVNACSKSPHFLAVWEQSD